MQHKSRLYDKRNLYLMYLYHSSIKVLFQECNARRLSQIISMNNKAIDRDVLPLFTGKSHKWNFSKPCKKHRRLFIRNRRKGYAIARAVLEEIV